MKAARHPNEFYFHRFSLRTHFCISPLTQDGALLFFFFIKLNYVD